MSDCKQTGIVTVSMDMLAQLLHFPEGHRVVDIRRRLTDTDQFQLLVEGPSLPSTHIGECTPHIQYVVTVTETGEMVPERKHSGAFSASTAPASEGNTG